MTAVDAAMRSMVLAFVRHATAEDPRGTPAVEHLARVSGGGRSRENWAFDLRWCDATLEDLILRRDPTGGLVETDRGAEFRLLAALDGTGLPVPRARWLDADGSWFGRPSLIMSRERGTSDYHLLISDRPEGERLRLAADLCALLARVHAVNPSATGLDDVLDDPGPHAAAAELDRWEAVLREDQQEAYPELELALRWMRRDPPVAAERVLVHGDFKAGNVLVDGSGITALLDWELAHFGDPCEDLGWMTQPLRTREQMIPGRWGSDEIISAYEAASERHVDRAAIGWWAVFATFRTAVMQVSGLRSYLEGRSPEPYRPTARVLGTLLELVDD